MWTNIQFQKFNLMDNNFQQDEIYRWLVFGGQPHLHNYPPPHVSDHMWIFPKSMVISGYWELLFFKSSMNVYNP